MNHQPIQQVAEMAQRISERTYIALAAAIFLTCVVLLYLYVSLFAAAVIGAMTAGMLLIIRVE
jgi:hypothetical protein